MVWSDIGGISGDLAQPANEEEELLPMGLRPGARLDIRYAIESDIQARGKASDSTWYSVQGRRAGKESQPERWTGASRSGSGLLTDKKKYGRYAEEPEPEPVRERNGYGGRDRRGREGGRDRSRSPAKRGGRQSAVDLDRELDMIRNGEQIPDQSRNGDRGHGRYDRDDRAQRNSRGGRREGNGGGGERRGQVNQNDLDAGKLPLSLINLCSRKLNRDDFSELDAYLNSR